MAQRISSQLRPGRRQRTAIVVGAGVIGLSVAVSLQRRDWEVTILDNYQHGWASPAAAGILFPTSAPLLSGVAGHLNLQSADLWPQWAESLGGSLLRSGGISFFADKDGQQDLATLAANAGVVPLSSGADCPGWDYLSSKAQSSVTAGLHLPAVKTVDPNKLLATLRRAAGANSIINDKAEELVVTSTGATGVVGSSGQRYHSAVIIAAPGSAPVDWLPHELRPKINSIVGEALILATEAFRYSPAAICPLAAGPLASRPGEVWLGGSYRPESEEQQPSLTAVQQIINRGIKLFPDLAQARVKKVLYGRRPVSADHLPVVGPSQLPGLYWAGGHGRSGILQSALIGKLIIDWLEKDRGLEQLLPERPALS